MFYLVRPCSLLTWAYNPLLSLHSTANCADDICVRLVLFSIPVFHFFVSHCFLRSKHSILFASICSVFSWYIKFLRWVILLLVGRKFHILRRSYWIWVFLNISFVSGTRSLAYAKEDPFRFPGHFCQLTLHCSIHSLVHCSASRSG